MSFVQHLSLHLLLVTGQTDKSSTYTLLHVYRKVKEVLSMVDVMIWPKYHIIPDYLILWITYTSEEKHFMHTASSAYSRDFNFPELSSPNHWHFQGQHFEA